MSKPLEILISGAGVAGPCISYWFTRAKLSAHITIIERFPRPRTSGQAVDIRDAGVDVIQAMGLEKAISEMHTTEEGFDFIYRDGVNSANFPATGDASSQSFTSEYEILRGDLGKLFYDATKDIKTIEYVFDEYVTEATENADGKKVRVAFANHLPEKEFDLVIGADGMVSTIRKIVWGAGPDGNQYLSRLGQYMAFFTIPKDKTDNKNSQWYVTTKGRAAVTRPSMYNDTRALFMVTDRDMSRFQDIDRASKKSVQQQKEWLVKEFPMAEWKIERLVKEMLKTDDFYMQEIAQVKMGNQGWAKGRVALCGDAAFCPSPITGMGTTSAIVGAYILAGELSRSPDDIPKALQQYQNVLQPFIDQYQKIIPGFPHLALPQTSWGVTILNSVVGFVASKWVRKVAFLVSSMIPAGFSDKKMELPKYSAFESR